MESSKKNISYAKKTIRELERGYPEFYARVAIFILLKREVRRMEIEEREEARVIEMLKKTGQIKHVTLT